ncbi:cupredoxin domain-containing protein [Lentzea nigeriaca]|uniref:cupredoxin domain-containing protein n=1 Tax=Lentzea nigeriaca TaxID=1128665 RepID=UPI0019562675|nr:cupredoxin family copper-binding protein [Lentzea nigeriaca]MBM7861546.1 plastocyanin [Lentzea nigeriaca]
MKRGLAGVVLAAFAVLTSTGSSWVSTVAAAETHQIPIARYAYVPATMTVHLGDVVTWTNQDEASHDVAGGTFRSPMLATGQSWSFTFTQPGTFDYICSVHPDMRAKIVVLANETTAAPPPPVQQQPVVQQPAPTTTISPAPPTATSTSAVAAVAAPRPTSSALPPMLLLAGLVAAVTTLCLLMISSRPDRT